MDICRSFIIVYQANQKCQRKKNTFKFINNFFEPFRLGPNMTVEKNTVKVILF